MMRCGLSFAIVAGVILQAAALHIHEVSQNAGHQDLVFMHIPYNFGHTIELVHATIPAEMHMIGHLMMDGGGAHDINTEVPMSAIKMFNANARLFKKNYQPWATFHPRLQSISNVTGQQMYFTPPKYWPQELAKSYFGNKTVFGVLRDPYERLVAMFRGDLKGYGAASDNYTATCDVNGAIKSMMRSAIKDPYVQSCAFLPQAEYFDGKYGIKLAIDNRRFPASMNEAFKAHGYKERIATHDCIHVKGCDDVWAGDLDAEAKLLVRRVFKRDFELLCAKFGYCDADENVCLQGVENMCPRKLFSWNKARKQFVRKG